MEITLLGNPLSTQHIYKITCRGGFGRMYMNKLGMDRKKDYQWQCKSQWKGDPVFYPLDIEVKIYFGDKRKRDIDNYGKLLWDSMKGIVYGDDNQIRKVSTELFYSKEKPRIELKIIKYQPPVFREQKN